MVSSPIGGFMPIPLAMMIPFMATQSMIMGVAFGEAYQYGKRKISAMTNEEFNAFTMEKMALEVFTDYKQIIPKLKDSIQDSTELQKHIVNEMLKLPFQLISGVGEQISENIQEHPQSTTPTQDVQSSARTPASRPTTKSATITGSITFWVNGNKQPLESSIWRFLERAYPKQVTINSIRSSGSKIQKITLNGVYYRFKYLYLITYTSAFPLPKTLTLKEEDLV